MRLPAIAHDQHGFVANVNAAAEVVFDNDINIKDRRLFVRDPDARTLLKNAVDQLKELLSLDSLALTIGRDGVLEIVVARAHDGSSS